MKVNIDGINYVPEGEERHPVKSWEIIIERPITEYSPILHFSGNYIVTCYDPEGNYVLLKLKDTAVGHQIVKPKIYFDKPFIGKIQIQF